MNPITRGRQMWRGLRLRLGGDDWMTARRQGFTWRLNRTHHLDRELYWAGVFEPATTARLGRVVQPGMQILDVGANIGYFSLLLARLAGPAGHVWAFEPTADYGRRLAEHVAVNGMSDRVTLVPWALSDAPGEAAISIGTASATLHPIDDATAPRATETIRLRRLDDVVGELGIQCVDLVKVDIDGHEPAFLRGAQETLRRHRPVMVMEFFQGNLDEAGSDVRQLKEQVEALGYRLHSDRTGAPFISRFDFLRECGNFNHSVNVWAYPDPGLKPSTLPGPGASASFPKALMAGDASTRRAA